MISLIYGFTGFRIEHLPPEDAQPAAVPIPVGQPSPEAEGA